VASGEMEPNIFSDLILSEHEGKWTKAMQVYDSLFQALPSTTGYVIDYQPSIIIHKHGFDKLRMVVIRPNRSPSVQRLGSGDISPFGGARAAASSPPPPFARILSAPSPSSSSSSSSSGLLATTPALQLHRGLMGSLQQLGCSHIIGHYMKDLARYISTFTPTARRISSAFFSIIILCMDD
jgi:hypothetical protein